MIESHLTFFQNAYRMARVVQFFMCLTKNECKGLTHANHGFHSKISGDSLWMESRRWLDARDVMKNDEKS